MSFFGPSWNRAASSTEHRTAKAISNTANGQGFVHPTTPNTIGMATNAVRTRRFKTN